MQRSNFLVPTLSTLLLFIGGATQAADVSQDAIDACIDNLRAQAGGGGGQVLSTEFSEANSLVMLQDAGGTVWRCLVSNDGANPYLEVSDAAPSGESPATADDGGGAMAGSMPADVPTVTGDLRVQFEPGTSGARYVNRLGSGEAVTYILGARDGQFLTVDLQGAVPNLDYIIYVPGGDILDQASQSSFHYEGQLYQSGEHRVEVFYNGNQGTYADFAISFEIQ